MFSLDLKGTQERDNHRCKGCVELSMREVSKKAGAKEMAEQKEHSVFHHTLRFLLLKKQVLAGNCPRAGITDTRSSTASYRCAPKKKKKSLYQRLRMLSSTLSYWLRIALVPVMIISQAMPMDGSPFEHYWAGDSHSTFSQQRRACSPGHPCKRLLERLTRL